MQALAERLAGYRELVERGEYSESHRLLDTTLDELDLAKWVIYRPALDPPTVIEPPVVVDPPGGGGRGGGSGSGGDTSRDTASPTATMKVARQRLRNVISRGLKVSVRTSEVGTASTRLKLAGRIARRLGLSSGRTVTVGRASSKLRAPGAHAPRVPLTRKAKTQFSRLRRVRLTVSTIVSDADGNVAGPLRRRVSIVR